MRKFHMLAILTAAALSLAGCNSKSDNGSDNKGGANPAPKKGGGHEPGPHGGTIFDWGGGKWHLEFCVDHGKKEARVYVFGDDEKTPSPIKADKLLASIKKPVFQLELKPEAQKGDPQGAYSCFIGTDDRLGVKQDFEGTVTGAVDGKQYNGDFKEDDEGHTHEHPPKK